MALLKAEKITCILEERAVLNSVSFTLDEGEILGIIGPNGAGKTMLLNVISGFVRVSEGSIHFNRMEITHKPPYRLSRLGIKRTFQIPRPLKEQTVIENVLLAYVMAGRKLGKLNAVVEKVNSILEQVMLIDKRDILAADLTLSEQRRLELARTLAGNPRLLLLDEVGAGLSPAMITYIQDLLEKLNKSGVTIILVDHFLNLSVQLAHRVIALDNGKIIAEGLPQKVLDSPRVREAYLG